MANPERLQIAIDGPAASGKSAVGSAVAQALGFPFIDTGSIYRALTWLAIARNIPPSDVEALTALAASASIELGPAPAGGESGPSPPAPLPNLGEGGKVLIDGLDATPHLRDPDVEHSVSLVSAVPGVRKHLVAIQRRLADGCTVMAGRDIGSVVLPDADLKIYLDASPEERARRRRDQLAATGDNANHDLLVEQMRRRDHLDSNRSVAPLQAPADAVCLLTDGMSLEDVIGRILRLYGERFGKPGAGVCDGRRRGISPGGPGS